MLNLSPPLVSEPERGLQGRVSLEMYQHRMVVHLCDPESSSTTVHNKFTEESAR